MRVRKFAAILLVLATALSLAACSGGSSGTTATSAPPSSAPATSAPAEAIQWRLGTTCVDPKANPDWNAWGLTIQKFCDDVNEKAAGRLVITPYYNSVIGGDTELFQAMVNGELEVYYGNGFSTFDPRFAWKGFPFIWDDYEDIRKNLGNPDGELFKINSSIMAEYGVKCLGQGSGMARGLANSAHPVKVPSDMKDLIIRTYEDKVVNSFFGGVSTIAVMPPTEIYTALQTGTITATETSDTVFLMNKYYEQCKYFTLLDWQISLFNFMVNDEIYNKLPADLQEIVWNASWDAVAYENELLDDFRAKAKTAMQEQGVEVYELTEADRAEWVKYARTLDSNLSELIGKDLFDQIMAVLAD